MFAEYPIAYEYKVRGWAQIYTASAGCLFSGVLVFLAMCNQDSFFGFIWSQKIISLSYWGSAVIVLSLSVYVLLRGYRQQKQDRKIIVCADSISLPKTIMSNSILDISYSTISSVQMYAPGRSSINIIRIKYNNTWAEISEAGFEKHATLNTIYEQIKGKTKL